MRRQSNKPLRWFIAIDIFLNAAALIGTASIIYTTYRGLSFGGLMALFLLLILVPYFFTTAIVLLLLLLYIKKKSWKLNMAAFALQILAPILWLVITNAFNSGGSWFEMIMILQIVAGIIGFLLRSPGREGE